MAKLALKAFVLALVLCCLPQGQSAYALGKKDTADQKSINDNWILCVTAFDYSNLPPSRRVAGDVITRNLIDTLKTVSYRLRISPEYAYYEGYAWQQSVNAAAKALSVKLDERSVQLYRGDPEWRYKKNLKRIDGEIEKLQKTLEEKEAEKPLVNNEPAFNLTQSNLNGTYPSPPKPGAERQFCRTQSADAFLLGEVLEFHNRYYVKLRLYTLYTNSYVYEDDVIFSMEDTYGAVEEISARLTAVLSGNKPSAIMVNADPPESQILLNRNYAGRGSVDTREHPPGIISVAVAAEGYDPLTVETELATGELTAIEVSLSPLQYSEVNIDIPDRTSVFLYQGALYVGEAPLTLRLPIDHLEYIQAETRGGEQAKAVFTSPDMPGQSFNFSLKTKIPPPSGQQRVNKARTRYYWSWGATWVSGIAAWITAGISSGRTEVVPLSSSSDFYASSRAWYYVSTGALVLFGAAAVYDAYEMIRYLITSSDGATPIVKQGKPKK